MFTQTGNVPFATIAGTNASGAASAIDAQLGEMMGDAPFCDVCTHVTIWSGVCYTGPNLGNSLGCS